MKNLFLKQCLFVVGFLLAIPSSFAHLSVKDQPHCVLLGPKPSLIVKFKNLRSILGNKGLSAQELAHLSTPGIIVTGSRPMSGGAYVINFAVQRDLQGTASSLKEIAPTCYMKKDLDQIIEHIKIQNPNVEEIFPNRLLRLLDLASTPIKVPFTSSIDTNRQWNLSDPPPGVNVMPAWEISQGNPNTVIAILDSGILKNDSLDRNVLPGVSFVNNGEFSKGAVPSCDASCEGYNHGTHVAGIVAATGVRAYSERIYGVSPASKVLPVNIFTKFENGPCGQGESCLMGYTSDEVDALNWLSGTHFDGLPEAPPVVGVNMSLGGEGACEKTEQEAFDRMMDLNVSIAVAAGNENTNASESAPANCNGVIPVAATDVKGHRATYSNWGSKVKIAAPGGDWWNQIYSTVLEDYEYMAGTSMACPHVAGVFALIYSIDPTLSTARVADLIQSTATPFPKTSDNYISCNGARSCGAGIINAYTVSTATLNQAPKLVFDPEVTISSNEGGSAVVSWTSASWSPAQKTPLRYTVKLNGAEVPSCKDLSGTRCLLNGLLPGVAYMVNISVTDYRGISSPVSSNPKSMTSIP